MKFPETMPGYAAKTFLYTLLAAVLCFFLHLSITMAMSIAGTEVLGRRTGGAMADGRTLVVEDYNANGDTPAHRRAYIVDEAGNEEVIIDRDLGTGKEEEAANQADKDLLATYEITQGYNENIRSEVAPAMRRLSNWVIQILALVLFLAFPYSNLWYMGDHDRNTVQFGHMAEDKLRGVKIGVLASLPALLAWLVLIAGKVANFAGYVRYYRWFNVCFWPYFNHFIPAEVVNPADVTWGAVAAMLPVLCALPVITGLGYRLGYSEFSVRDRLVYAATGKKPKRRKK